MNASGAADRAGSRAAWAARRIELAIKAAALGRAARTASAVERRARFAELRRGGYTIQEAAWELGVCRRTADRYEAVRLGRAGGE